MRQQRCLFPLSIPLFPWVERFLGEKVAENESWIISEKFSSTEGIFSSSFLQIEAFFDFVLLARNRNIAAILCGSVPKMKAAVAAVIPCLLLLQTTLCLARAKLFVPPVCLRFSVHIFTSTYQPCSAD